MTTPRMNTNPPDIQAALRLQTWLSPAFPTGSFTYSHGLETLITDGRIATQNTLYEWIDALLKFGSAKSDAIMFCQAWHAVRANDPVRLQELNDLALALQPSSERYEETTSQANAFSIAIENWPGHNRKPLNPKEPLSLPLAVALHCESENLELTHCLSAYLNAFTANLIWIAVRLVPLGQNDGLKTVSQLENSILKLCQSAISNPIDAIGTSTIFFDIASQNHEHLITRICKS